MLIWNYTASVAVAWLLTVAGAQRISQTNESLSGAPTFELIGGRMEHLASLTPLTVLARREDFVTGTLTLAVSPNAANFSTGRLAYIGCDDEDYTEGNTALDFVQQITGDRNSSAVILFSRYAQGCAVRDTNALEPHLVYSMTDAEISARFYNALQSMSGTANMQFVASIRRDQSQGPAQNGVLGGTPSTAVAMIILYSITGVITALFLIIIMTGAIRAHRHPERYGPRDVQGRPRQSRARGIARAMLDTLPIVKFGENDPPKPTDVELGTRSGSAAEGERRASRDGAVPAQNEDGTPKTTEMTAAGAAGAAGGRKSVGDTNGIAPAEVRGGEQPNTTETGLECSICAEEFERGQDVRVLPCDHKFHAGCVDQWLLNVSGTCPLCRVDLRPTPSNTAENESGALSPPLDAEAAAAAATDRDQRRRSALQFLRNPGRPISRAERMEALRVLREPEITDASGNTVPASRRRRLTMRLQEAFNVRTRSHTTSSDTATPAVPEATATPATNTAVPATVSEEPRTETPVNTAAPTTVAEEPRRRSLVESAAAALSGPGYRPS